MVNASRACKEAQPRCITFDTEVKTPVLELKLYDTGSSKAIIKPSKDGYSHQKLILLCGRNCQALLSAFSSFLRSTAPFLRTMDVVTHILVVSTSGRTARVTHPVAASAFCVSQPRLSAGLFMYGVLLAS
jgi:hypothetical protein